MAHWVTLQQQSGLQDFIFADIIYHTHTHMCGHTLDWRSLNSGCHPHPLRCSCPPSTLYSVRFPPAAADGWNHGCLSQHPWCRADSTDLKSEVASGHLKGHWLCACKWREQIARPILKAAMASSAEQRHRNLGVTMTPSVLPPASLYHYVLTFLRWSYGLKNASPITSQVW